MGAFDGLHRGHQALLERAQARAGGVALVTFDPHPARVLAPDRAPRLLQTPTLRRRVAEALGVANLVLLPFDREMSKLSPEAFITRYVTEGLRPTALLVGEDFRFGAGRAGDVSTLADLLAPAGIALEVVPAFALAGDGGDDKVSSSDIRSALEEGRVDDAATMLGRYHSVHGRVVEGAKRGRTIGFPTANVDYGGGFLPPSGVYATFTTVWDRSSPDYGACWASVTNLGLGPTFDGDRDALRLESHVLREDLGERLYGVELEVAFAARLRSEHKFDGPAALVEQIRRDVTAAEAILAAADRSRVLTPPPAVAEET
jgi:riboflavin kinase/FMN adenylyltransferase